MYFLKINGFTQITTICAGRQEEILRQGKFLILKDILTIFQRTLNTDADLSKAPWVISGQKMRNMGHIPQKHRISYILY
jgi:hypothetical protein